MGVARGPSGGGVHITRQFLVYRAGQVENAVSFFSLINFVGCVSRM